MESHAKFILFGLHVILNVIAVLLNVSLFQDAGGRLGFCFGDRSSKWQVAFGQDRPAQNLSRYLKTVFFVFIL